MISSEEIVINNEKFHSNLTFVDKVRCCFTKLKSIEHSKSSESLELSNIFFDASK